MCACTLLPLDFFLVDCGSSSSDSPDRFLTRPFCGVTGGHFEGFDDESSPWWELDDLLDDIVLCSCSSACERVFGVCVTHKVSMLDMVMHGWQDTVMVETEGEL
jgi:hypothetical protein